MVELIGFLVMVLFFASWAAFPLGVVAVIYLIWRRMSGVRQAWAQAADQLGLELSNSSWHGQRPRLRGTIDGTHVEVKVLQRGSGDHTSTYTVYQCHGRSPLDLSLGSETWWTGVTSMIRGKDVATGHRTFDDAIHIRGEAAMVQALMTADTRRTVTEAVVQYGFHLKNGAIRTEHRGAANKASTITQHVNAMVALDAALQTPKDVSRALHRQVISQDLPEVRAQALRTMLRSQPKEVAHETLTTLLAEDKPPALKRVAIEEAIALAPDQLRPRLSHFYGDPQLRNTAVAAAIRLIEMVPEAIVEDLFRSDKAGMLLAIRAARGHSLRFVPAIVALLDHDSDDIKEAAINTLGLVGNVRTVEPLLPFTEGLFRNPTLKAQARKAIGKIQKRVDKTSVGGLALAEEDVKRGQLSEAADPGGLAEAKPD